MDERVWEELRDRYLSGLPLHAKALADAVMKLPDSDRSVRRLAHSLRGSGATYGYDAISAAAAEVEDGAPDDLPRAVGILVRILYDVSASQDRGREEVTVTVVGDAAAEGLVRRALGVPGPRIVAERTAAAARDRLEREEGSVLVLELVLPDADGRDLLSWFLGRPESALVPALVIGDSLEPRIRSECVALGAEACLAQPVEPDALRAAVEKALAARVVQPEERISAPTTPDRHAFRLELATRRERGRTEGVPVFAAFVTVLGATADLMVPCQLLGGALPVGAFVAQWSEQVIALCVEAPRLGDAEKLVRQTLQGLAAGEGVPAMAAGVVDATRGSMGDVLQLAHRMSTLAATAGPSFVVRAEPELPANPTVVYVEDDPLIADVVRAALESEGIVLEHHFTGEAFLEELPRLDADLVLLDVELPGADGFELLEHIRARKDLDRMPVVMLTAMGHQKHVQLGFELGADDYVPKPFEVTTLLARLRRHLHAAAARARR
ncbi:MAG: response regulator [Deltaproteobacteria bacterium]|nr:response regulator [Deltaproteobacteria bacterium]